MSETGRRLVVAVTGASGALYAVRFVKACLELGIRIDLVVSHYGQRLLIEECDLNLKATGFGEWLDSKYGPADRTGRLTEHRVNELGSAIASGSQPWDGMVVIPCPMKTPAGIAYNDGHLYVCDTGRGVVHDWDLGTGAARCFGAAGETVLAKPVAVASPSVAAPTARATPKSAIRACPSASRIFPGLISRWTTPCRWA